MSPAACVRSIAAVHRRDLFLQSVLAVHSTLLVTDDNCCMLLTPGDPARTSSRMLRLSPLVSFVERTTVYLGCQDNVWKEWCRAYSMAKVD